MKFCRNIDLFTISAFVDLNLVAQLDQRLLKFNWVKILEFGFQRSMKASLMLKNLLVELV